MNMLFIHWLLNEKLIKAICWALLHSLWQGLVFTIVAAIVILFTRRSSPVLRYNLFTALFGLFLVITGFTFMSQVSTKQIQPQTFKISSPERTISNTGTVDAEPVKPASTYHTIVDYCNTHASIIVATWFILFTIKLTRMMANMGYIQRIRRHRTFEPPSYWKQRLTELSKSLRIEYNIILLESTIIKVPMVIGILKPVILVPLGLLSNLPPEQIEAVLLHELAHIRRRDYLVNLLQSFAEVVFFFNPAVLWLSSLIRQERENCCDDIAVCCTKDKSQFIHALLAFQEYVMNQSNKGIVIGFAGPKKYLLNRVKRIIYNENKKLNAMEKGILIFSIAVTSCIGFATIRQSSVHWPLSKVHSSAATADTIPAKQTSRATDSIPRLMEFNSVNSVSNKEGDSRNRVITAVDKNGKKYKLVEKNDEPVELFVDDKKVPPGELSNYENIIKHIEEEVELRERTMQEKLKKDHAEQGQQVAKLNAERNELLQKLSELDQERARLRLEKDNQLWDHEWENAANNKSFDLLVNPKQENQVRFDSLSLTNSELSPMFYDKLESLKKMNADNLYQQKLLNENRKDINDKYLDKLAREDFDQQHQTELLNEKLGLLKNSALEQQQYHTYVLIDPIIQDMVEQKIVPEHQEELSFELNNNGFIVNGKKQPIEIHERFRKKYLKKKGDYFKFSRKSGHTSTSINLDSDEPE